MLPQLDYTTYPLQIFWLLINIPLLYFCISVIVVPRIDAIINKRQSIVEENQRERVRNDRAAVEEEEKYNVAIRKAHLLAQDIIKDSRALVEQSKVNAYKQLKEEIHLLQKQKQQEINILLDSSKQQAVDEVIKVIDIYYQNLNFEEINGDKRQELRKDIEGML